MGQTTEYDSSTQPHPLPTLCFPQCALQPTVWDCGDSRFIPRQCKGYFLARFVGYERGHEISSCPATSHMVHSNPPFPAADDDEPATFFSNSFQDSQPRPLSIPVDQPHL